MTGRLAIPHRAGSWPRRLGELDVTGLAYRQEATVDLRRGSFTVLVSVLAALAVVSSLVGVIASGGPGRHTVTTARGAAVILYGEGLYAADAWLLGVGNRGQDEAILLVEVPILLLALRWYRRGGRIAPAALVGVLAFFSYYYVSMTFGTAQNRLFPVYVAAASVAGFALVIVASRMNVFSTAAAIPERPGRRALAIYLFAVAAALTLAWLPELVVTTITGNIAVAVGPYTSSATHALDLGLVVPVAVLAAAKLLRNRPSGLVLALIMLVINVCVGTLLMGQGIAQLVAGVPLTPAEIVAKMATFAALTVVAGGLLARLALAGVHRLAQVTSGPAY
jgi:hypothetical protein